MENMPSSPVYTNPYISCYNDRLVVHNYDYPQGDKTLKYHEIHSCKFRLLKQLNFLEVKMIGMGFSYSSTLQKQLIWWPRDLQRHSSTKRKHCLILYLKGNPYPNRIGVTMSEDQIEQIYEFIQNNLDTRSVIQDDGLALKYDSEVEKKRLDEMQRLIDCEPFLSTHN
ncbi:unnamed protein product [Didymodactylos carnosus]|uniref:Uncharacterized protein n=2 Tax=Didymodactylos carnosus TaxID=1234261 RepID=A0A8S2EZE7_9BILA|nr:unnamed protein product [Didymodactylos carnosus]CAF4089208.1 unnamed protein product [Didymodactylos carnosus]